MGDVDPAIAEQLPSFRRKRGSKPVPSITNSMNDSLFSAFALLINGCKWRGLIWRSQSVRLELNLIMRLHTGLSEPPSPIVVSFARASTFGQILSTPSELMKTVCPMG